MIACGLGIVLLGVLGAPIVAATDRDAPPGTFIGLSFLLGTGFACVVLLALSLAGAAWTPIRFAAAAFAPWALAVVLAARRRKRSPATPRPAKRPYSALAIACDLVVAVLIIGHGIFATRAPLPQWDFWSDWGLKAKVFWGHGSLDFAFLKSPENFYAHPDYPPLLPLAMDFLSLVRGAWEDRWIGLLFTAFAAALLLVARDLAREELESSALGSLAILSVAGPALVIWIGLAEGPLIAYGCLGLLRLRRALARNGEGVTSAALLLGCAALTKNEGLALLASAALAILVWQAGRFSVLRGLWPAVLLSAAWLWPRMAHGLSSELFAGDVGSRLVGRIADPRPLLAALREIRWHDPWLWAAAVASLLLFPAVVSRERFLLSAVTAQLLFSLLVYAATPHPLAWHVRNSSERFLSQQTFAVAFVAVAALLSRMSRRTGDSPARPGPAARMVAADT